MGLFWLLALRRAGSPSTLDFKPKAQDGSCRHQKGPQEINNLNAGLRGSGVEGLSAADSLKIQVVSEVTGLGQFCILLGPT